MSGIDTLLPDQLASKIRATLAVQREMVWMASEWVSRRFYSEMYPIYRLMGNGAKFGYSVDGIEKIREGGSGKAIDDLIRRVDRLTADFLALKLELYNMLPARDRERRLKVWLCPDLDMAEWR